MLGMFQTIF